MPWQLACALHYGLAAKQAKHCSLFVLARMPRLSSIVESQFRLPDLPDLSDSEYCESTCVCSPVRSCMAEYRTALPDRNRSDPWFVSCRLSSHKEQIRSYREEGLRNLGNWDRPVRTEPARRPSLRSCCIDIRRLASLSPSRTGRLRLPDSVSHQRRVSSQDKAGEAPDCVQSFIIAVIGSDHGHRRPWSRQRTW